MNFIFVVDLYNKGVDIPEVDAALFLRPTQSLTVFLQPLGRRLRLHSEKDCLARFTPLAIAEQHVRAIADGPMVHSSQ